MALKVMKTTYEQDFNSNQDILMCVAYHNNKIVGCQGAKCPFLTSHISPRYQEFTKRLQTALKVMKTTYKQDFKASRQGATSPF